MKQIPTPAMCIVSGPATALDLCAQALYREGFIALLPHNHGLPSYTDPITAHAAGAPNSGHTPGTLHPAQLTFLTEAGPEERENPVPHAGEPYEDDPSIAFLAVPSDDPNRIASIVEPHGWSLRMHTDSALQIAEDDMPVADRIARIESDLEIVRRGR